MNIEYLKNYVAVVEEKNISKASKLLFIAQPSLSNQIKYLEDLYQTKLMYRGGRTIRLTPAGKELYIKAKKIINIYYESFINLNNISSGFEHELNIALPPTIYSSFVNKIFSKFLKEYPNVKLNIYECNSLLAESYLNDNIVDIAIINSNIKDLDRVNYVNLEKEDFIVLIPENSKLLKKEVIDLKDLSDKHIAIPRAYENKLIEHFHELNLNPIIDITTTTTMASIVFAKQKNIFAVIPFPMNEKKENDHFKPLKVNNVNELTRKLIWLKNKELSFICKEFIKMLKEQ